MVTFFGEATVYNLRGRAQHRVKRMVIEGEIIANGATAINQRVGQIQAAFAADFLGRVILKQSNGATTLIHLPIGSLSGIRVIERPSFFMQDGKAHFATGLPFRIILEADYQYNDADPYVSYNETITRIGDGGPRRVTIELDSGLPIEQIVSQNTPITVIQSGEAVGSLLYPPFPPPIFPSQVDLPDGYVTSTAHPRLHGNLYVDWPIRWQYRMTLLAAQNIPTPVLR